MVNIPINPSLIANAATYNAPLVSVPSNVCNTPKEGPAFVPMQFDFTHNAVYSVNLAGGVKGNVISQIAAMYVDLTNCTHDVNILFPDSGYQVRCPSGSQQLFPILTAASAPPFFYVILDSSGVAVPGDMANIFVMNQFIPEFTTLETATSFINALAFGYGPGFTKVPTFTQSNAFSFSLAATTLSAGDNITTLMACTQFYITGYIIEFSGAATGADVITTIELVDNNSSADLFPYKRTFLVDGNFSYQGVALGGLNYISSIGTGLTANINIGNQNFSNNSYFSINVLGGILTP